MLFHPSGKCGDSYELNRRTNQLVPEVVKVAEFTAAGAPIREDFWRVWFLHLTLEGS